MCKRQFFLFFFFQCLSINISSFLHMSINTFNVSISFFFNYLYVCVEKRWRIAGTLRLQRLKMSTSLCVRSHGLVSEEIDRCVVQSLCLFPYMCLFQHTISLIHLSFISRLSSLNLFAFLSLSLSLFLSVQMTHTHTHTYTIHS
jgi:hypothetical protein